MTKSEIIIGALLILLLVVVFATKGARAQEIDYCRTAKGEIITIGAGSPCPTGSYPL